MNNVQLFSQLLSELHTFSAWIPCRHPCFVKFGNARSVLDKLDQKFPQKNKTTYETVFFGVENNKLFSIKMTILIS